MLQVVVSTCLYRAPHDRENTTVVEAGVVDRQQVTPNERMVVPRQRPVTSLLLGNAREHRRLQPPLASWGRVETSTE